MNEPMWVIVPAAGRGERMGNAIPKQYLQLGDSVILQATLSRLFAVEGVVGIVVVLSPNDTLWPATAASKDPRVHVTEGGTTRAESVEAGLQYVLAQAESNTWVLVHDAARPLIQASDVKRLTDAVYNSGAVGGLLATPVQDTLKKADDYCHVEGTVSRQHLWQAQTPQLFRASELLDALLMANQQGVDLTDEASAMESLGHEPLLVEALQPNFKITRPADLMLARALLAFDTEPPCA